MAFSQLIRSLEQGEAEWSQLFCSHFLPLSKALNPIFSSFLNASPTHHTTFSFQDKGPQIFPIFVASSINNLSY